ncbi:MAG: hypothetical protein ACJATF_001645, partial [Flavobacteriales bacterium]
KYILFSLVLLASSQNGVAQIIKGKKNKYKAAEHIVALKEGTLVMLLSSKHKNILAIEKALGQKGLSSKSKKRLNKNRTKILQKQKKANGDIVYALGEHYDFSELRILYDTAMVHILAGKSSGYFLDNDLKIDPSINIDHNAPIYSVRFGQGSVSETNNFEGFIIRDSDNEQPPKPFPYFVKANYPPSSVFAAFIGKGADVSPDFFKMISKLNINLTNYYPEAQFKITKKKLRETFEKQQKEAEGKREN